MPVWYSPVDETDIHVVYPVTKQFIHKLLTDLNLREVVQDRIYISTGWSGNKTSRYNHSAALWKDNVKVEVSISYPGSPKWDANTVAQFSGHGIYQSHLGIMYPTVFCDDTADISLREMILPMTLNFQIQLQIKDRNRAYRIPGQIIRRYTPGVVFGQTVTYDYPLPNDLLSLLFSLYKLRKFDGERPSFSEYLRKNSRNATQFSAHRTMRADELELVIKKYILNALVTYEYSEDKPQEIKSNELSYGYSVSLNATIQFQYTDNMLLEYPCVVDNTLLPPKMITTTRNDADAIQGSDGDYPLKVFDGWIKAQNTQYFFDHPVVAPFYDDFRLPRNLFANRSYVPVYQAMFLIDEENEYTEIPLGGDLGDGYVLHPILVKMLKKEKNEAFRADVPFNIAVYSGFHFYTEESLSIDENLVLRVKTSNIHKPKRVVISEITDIRNVNSKWWPDILEDWPFYKITDQIKDAIDKGILNEPITKNDIADHFGAEAEYDAYWTLRIIHNTIVARRSVDKA